MGRDDWFRNEDWDAGIAAAFDARLGRARKDNRPQYLRIQALHLAGTHPREALALLDRYEAAGGDLSYAMALCQRASLLAALGDEDGAALACEAALDREAAVPNVRSNAFVDYPYLVAARGMQARFARALAVLDEGAGKVTFPVQRYMWHAARALIRDAMGDRAGARQDARFALDEAGEKHSGVERHPGIGLVGRDLLESPAHRRITALARPGLLSMLWEGKP